MKRNVIIVAGGIGKRMNADIPKQFLLLKGKPVLIHTMHAFYEYDNNINIITVLPVNYVNYWKQLCHDYSFDIEHEIITGGDTRFVSVQNALKNISDEGLTAVHDGIRPFVSQETIKRCFDTAKIYGSALPVIPLKESIRYVNKNESKYLNRKLYQIVQTPQVFQSRILKEAYVQKFEINFTDDASVVEAKGYKVIITQGNEENIKITTPLDMKFAEILVNIVE